MILQSKVTSEERNQRKKPKKGDKRWVRGNRVRGKCELLPLHDDWDRFREWFSQTHKPTIEYRPEICLDAHQWRCTKKLRGDVGPALRSEMNSLSHRGESTGKETRKKERAVDAGAKRVRERGRDE
jgi:hypothetical protein